MAEESKDESDNSENGSQGKRSRKIRDLFTDRVVGIVSGACIPIVLLFIPLINKYLDNTKEIQTLQIKENADDINETKARVTALTGVIVAAQLQIQQLSNKLLECEKKIPLSPDLPAVPNPVATKNR